MRLVSSGYGQRIRHEGFSYLKNVISLFLAYGTVAFFLLGGTLLHGEVLDDEVRLEIGAILDETIKIFNDTSLSANAKRALLERQLRENLDLSYMSADALGPQGKAFTKEEFTLFSHEFSKYILHFYLHRISTFEGDSFKVQNVKTVDGSRDVIVRALGGSRPSLFKVKGPRHAQVDFRIRQHGEGWRIIAIALDGMNVSRNFRGQFKGMLSQDDPLGLVEALRKKNAENDLANPFLKASE